MLRLLKIASGAAGALVLMSACSTARLDAQWADPAAQNRSIGGAKVLIACEAAETTLKRICQDKLAAEVAALGGTAVRASETGDQFLAAARNAGAQQMIVTRLHPNTAVAIDSGPSVGFGIGGSRGHIGSGVGIFMPFPGGAYSAPSTTYSSDSAVTNVQSGKVVWSGKASTDDADLALQIERLLRVSLEAARKAGAI